jgi:hypothetical protein
MIWNIRSGSSSTRGLRLSLFTAYEVPYTDGQNRSDE